MANFDALTITDYGRTLQAKVQTGTPLVFTRIVLGDGLLEEGETPEVLLAVKSEKKSLLSLDVAVVGDGTSRIRAALTNEDLQAGFYLREIGLCATDPDIGEVLYSYANAGEFADFIPAGTGSTIVETVIDLITVVGNAANVTAEISESLVYVTLDQYGGTTLQLRQKDAQQDVRINSLAIELSVLRGVAVGGITTNIFVEDFSDLTGVAMTDGVYDADNDRIYA